MLKVKNQQSKIKNYFTYLIVLFPILGQYGFLTRSVTFADIFLVIGLSYLILKMISTRKIEIADKKFAIFTIWYIIISIIMSLCIANIFSISSVTGCIKCTVYALAILLISGKYIDMEKVVKIYSVIVIVLSALIFIQQIQYLITGTISPWVINSKLFPAVYVNDDYFSGGYLTQLGGDTFRAASIFSEPALFAQYVCPCLVLNIFYVKNKYQKYAIMSIATLATLMTKSANGIVYVCVIWLFALIYNLVKFIQARKRSIKVTNVLLIALIILIPIVFFTTTSNQITTRSSSLISRIEEISDPKGETSGSMRVVRGWKIYAGLQSVEKIFGIGEGNIVNYLNLHPTIVTMFSEAYNGYMSGLPAIFVNSGLIGGMLFLVWWLFTFIKGRNVVKGLLIFLMLYLLASSSLFTSNFVLIIILIITLANQEKLVKNNEYR